jgi:hypothetical protein
MHQGNLMNRHTAPKRDGILDWIYNHVKNWGEAKPNNEGYELPANTKGHLWVDYAFHESINGRPYGVYDYFCEIWREHFSHVTLPKESRWVILFGVLFIHFLFRSNVKNVNDVPIF